MTPTQRAAMEQAEKWLAWITDGAVSSPPPFGAVDVLSSIRAALAEPVGEPVAGNHIADHIVRACCESEIADPENPDTICLSVHDLIAIVHTQLAPQPPAPAVRLTDEDIDALAEAHRSEYGQLCDRLDLQMFARAAIAAHEAKKGQQP